MGDYNNEISKKLDDVSEQISFFDHSMTTQEKEVMDTLTEIYSIIITLDQVEKAYLKDNINSNQYTTTVYKLLAQYNTYLSNEDIARRFIDLQHFKQKWNINAPNAITRIEKGIPVTVEHGIDDSNSKNMESKIQKFSGKRVAEATGNFITIMDALKLNYRAKDQLHPLISELLLSINRVSSQDFEHRNKLVEWIVKINKMKINESLNDDEIRELLFDLDVAYKSFYTLLE